MIHSMTGYSSVRTEEEDGLSLSVSVKSTNHRYLDLQVRLTGGLEPLEPLLRRLVKEQVTRGHLELTVSLVRRNAPGIQFDRKLLGAYVGALKELGKEFGLTGEPDLVSLLRVPGIVASGNGEIPGEEIEPIRQVLERTVTETLRQLNEMRAREGEALERDVKSRLERLAALRESIHRHADSLPRLYQRRLESRLRALLQDVSGGASLDPARLVQEVALLASHSDISEELARFRSHLDQTKQLLERGVEIGKKLDFLLQEMNREANTLLSKTTDVPEVGLEIAQQAIEMKTEIEKLREQAQNIE